MAPRPNITAGLNTSYIVSAYIDVPASGAEGMLLTSGGRFGGYGFYLKNGKPVWLWNMVDLERLKWEGAEPLAPGKHKVEFDFIYQGKGAGTLACQQLQRLWRQDDAHDPAMG